MTARIIKINLNESEKKIFNKFIINDLKEKISNKDINFQNKNGHFISNLYAIDLKLLSNVITEDYLQVLDYQSDDLLEEKASDSPS